MPNIVEQRVDDAGIYIKASNGNTVTILTASILAHYVLQLGTVVEKQLNTRAWLKNTITSVLGEDQLDYAEMDVDFNVLSGVPTVFTVTEG